MHKSPLKTLHLITLTFLDVGKPILCELARQLPLMVDFKYLLKKLWRFFSKSKFTPYDTYAGIILYFLGWLIIRKYLEIIVDWTKIGNYSVLYLSIPYKKRALPLFWRVVEWTTNGDWQNVLYHKTNKERLNILLKYESQDPVYIGTNLSDPDEVLEVYGHRMRIEESFRDFKNKHCFSLREAKLKGRLRMEKLILMVVIAYLFVILFGAACESVPWLIKLVTIPKREKQKSKLLSSFRVGWSLLKKLSLSVQFTWLFNFKEVCPKEA